MGRVVKIGLVAVGMLLILRGSAKEGNERTPKTAIGEISLKTETDSLVQLRSVTDARGICLHIPFA